MDELTSKSLNERLNQMGPIRIKEVDKAQSEIIAVTNKLVSNNIIKLNQ